MRKKTKDPKVRNDTSTKAKKVVIKKAKGRFKAPKVRNNNTMTESEFWSFIRAALRNKTRFWKPRLKVIANARRPYTAGINKRQKFEYQCNHCKNYFIQTQVEVNHKFPCGTLKCGEDLNAFVENLFCEADKLEVCCKPCHKKFHAKPE